VPQKKRKKERKDEFNEVSRQSLNLKEEEEGRFRCFCKKGGMAFAEQTSSAHQDQETLSALC
jgi:hypothetical protein